ncbi:MAG TPA: T9SS type A sorting domain-containing protein [bacterium]|jgi:hypothetical protein
MKKSLIVLLLLAAFCTLSLAGTALVLPSNATPSEYAAWKASLAPRHSNGALDYADRLCNSLVCVQINDAGDFNIGTADGRSLLYYYPSEPGTSHIIVAVDGAHYRLDAFQCDGSATYNGFTDDGTSITTNYTLLSYLNVQVIHTPVAFTATTGAILTRTIVTNNDPTGATHTIGVMYEYDTTVDGDDAAQLYLGPTYETVETCLDAPYAYPYWDAIPASGSLVGRGTFVGGAAITPDHIGFGSWPHFVGVCWNEACSGSPYGDSAVRYLWDEQPVPANGTRTVATYYGVGELVVQPGQLALGVGTPGLECTSNGVEPNPFQVTVNVTNNGGSSCENINVTLTNGSGPGGTAAITSTNPVVIPVLTPGDHQSVTFTLNGSFAPAGGCINATASVTSANCDPNAADFCITVPPCQSTCFMPYTQVDMGNLGECYPTKTNNPGHGLSGVAWLGPQVTGEAHPPVSSSRDCFGNTRDLPPLDPGTDGVAFFGIPWQPCTQVTVAVMVTAGPHYGAYAECGGHLYLNGWQDGNLNGNFDDNNSCGDGTTSEWVIQDAPVTPGLHLYTFKNPFDANLSRPVVGTFRFRLNSHPVGRSGYGMNATDPHCPPVAGNFDLDFLGEVEDYILCDFMLAVELTSFDAQPNDGAIDLSWVSASEMQNDHYEIVRDGAAIAQIAGNNGNTQHTYSYTDNSVVNGTVYNYTLVAVDVNGGRRELRSVSTTPAAGVGAVTEFALKQNYPNPFNPTTSITFDLPASSHVMLKVYNMVGQEVATLANGALSSGRHSVSFDATNLPSGLYIYRMEAGSFSATKKMLLMK